MSKRPWEILHWATIGDADADSLYKAVGKTLSSWELVEETVAHLFALFTSSPYKYPQFSPSIRAFGSVPSFNGRADMVQAAGDSYFHWYKINNESCPFENFSPLIDEYRGWSGRRNDVAHGKVDQQPEGYFLVPGLYNTKKQRLSEVPTYRYNAEQISKFGEAFEDLYDRISEHVTGLENWLHTSLQNIVVQRP